MSGIKYDEDKPRVDLLSPTALLGTASVLAFGAKKYSERNWEEGLDYGRVYAAMFRHMLAWWDGEDLDPETGLSHLHHAATCVMFLQHYVEYGTYGRFDTRPKEEGYE